MEYQEDQELLWNGVPISPWSSMEYREAPWNTEELSRNTKKFVGIPEGIDETLVQIRAQIRAVQS